MREALQAGQQNQPLLADALWLEGKLPIAQRDRAAALARQLPYPSTGARALAALATLRGEPEQARERPATARLIVRRLGAHEDVAQADNALAQVWGSFTYINSSLLKWLPDSARDPLAAVAVLDSQAGAKSGGRHSRA